MTDPNSAPPYQPPPLLPDEAAILDMLFRLAFSRHEGCPGCRSRTARFYKLSARKAYICQFCGHKIYPCANTFLHKSSTKLSKWLHAMLLLSQSRGTITARELGAQLRVTYKCAWRIRNQLRNASRGTLPAYAATSTAPPDYPALLAAFGFAARQSAFNGAITASEPPPYAPPPRAATYSDAPSATHCATHCATHSAVAELAHGTT